MAPRAPSRFWQRCRTCFRWFRIAVWLLLLAVVCSLLYLNLVGLPGFLKRPLVERLRAQGLDLEFARLRWRGFRGIVAENVTVGHGDAESGQTLTFKEVQLRLRYGALLRRQFQTDALILKEGRFVWQVSGTNEPAREVSIDNIQTELRLLPKDLWELQHFQAEFAGAKIELAGAITNASAIRDWKFLKRRGPGVPANWPARLRRFADALERIRFSMPPELKMNLHGDARDPRSFEIQLGLEAPDADTPWGKLHQGAFSLMRFAALSNQPPRSEIKLHAENALTPWGATTNLALAIELFEQGETVNATDGDLSFNADYAETKWGLAKDVQLKGTLTAVTNAAATDESWGRWTNLAPFAIDWDLHCINLQSPKLQAQEIACSGQWRAPNLNARRIFAKLYDGHLDADAQLNVATRDLTFTVASDFDAQQVKPLLTPGAQRWMSQFTWQKPPEVKAEGAVVLPAWTNRHPDWRGEVRPTLRLNGQFHVEEGTFRGVPASTADSHFSYSNLVWNLPDLAATRSEGKAEILVQSSDRTKEFYFRFHSAINLGALRPLFEEPKQQREFDRLTFNQPSEVEGEVWGRWKRPDLTGFRGRAVGTNFVVRGQDVGEFHTSFEYTNRFLKLISPRLQRGTNEYASADSIGMDFVDEKIYLTNGFGRLDPMAVVGAIGPKVSRAIRPYQFFEPPTARVEGIIPMRNEEKADLHFDLDGGPFEWWKFHMAHVAGKIDWVGKHLDLRDVTAEFYKGMAVGHAGFDFGTPGTGADLHFEVVATDANIHLLAADLSEKTNKMEGLLVARLNITSAHSDDWRTWQGSGRAHLRDGVIWDIPIFGIFSPVLDALVPGLGSSRAREGTATFIMTNGVMRTDDLEVQTLMARLRYRGTVEIGGKVDARLQAELLRNTWVIGPILSFALWPVSKIFEYQVSGTYSAPKIEPVYIPKFLLFPFQPFNAFKDIVPESTSQPKTNPSY